MSDDHQQKPLCFVLMPFGTKPAEGGRQIRFDTVYQDLIRPAIEEAGMTPIRADEERVGGIIHKPMFERLILCDFAVADLTTANANVFYELGVRHALRPWSTIAIFAEGNKLPFDLGPVRALRYGLSASGGPSNVDADRTELAKHLEAARQRGTDSPLFQLLTDLKPVDVQHLKTDVFRESVKFAEQARLRLSEARSVGLHAVAAVEADLGALEDVEAGVLIDLLLSYRAVSAWHAMIRLVEAMPEPISRTTLVREQLGFALNRAGRGDQAERELRRLLTERGASSETYGILGRVYKDRWKSSKEAGEVFQARGALRQAIAAYLEGFETDWRDAYPGVNAVTLMEMTDPPDPRQADLPPIVRYAVERRIAAGASAGFMTSKANLGGLQWGLGCENLVDDRRTAQACEFVLARALNLDAQIDITHDEVNGSTIDQPV